MAGALQLPPAVLARFEAQIFRSEDGCWLWTGRKSTQGYGLLGAFGGYLRTHIVAYALWVDDIPEGHVIDHFECDNKACCRPDHLKAVTSWENTARGESVVAQQARKTMCSRGHPFDGVDRRGLRRCSLCANERNRQYRERKREQRAAARRS